MAHSTQVHGASFLFHIEIKVLQRIAGWIFHYVY